MTEKFKTSLFGYSKRAVCEYISKASDELTVKHSIQKKELEDKIFALQEENARLILKTEDAAKKIEALETRLAEATDENKQVSEIIIDARRFADELKNKAIEQNEQEINENKRRNEEVASSIKKGKEEVESIREFLREFLKKTDVELDKIEKNLDGVNLLTE